MSNEVGGGVLWEGNTESVASFGIGEGLECDVGDRVHERGGGLGESSSREGEQRKESGPGHCVKKVR